MKHEGVAALSLTATMVICGCLLSSACQAATFHGMKADRILFLGNSITLHGVHQPYGWLNYCGMAASVPEKDYVHQLVARIDAVTGEHLRISPTEDAEPANILNVADILERQYATYTNDRLRKQIDRKPDLVILQFGENTPREGFDAAAFKTAVQTLMDGLRDSSSPQMFVVSQILGAGGALDDAKREVCAEGPSHRAFVDLSDFGKDPTNLARSEPYYTGIITGHPGDQGMARIAEAVFNAMVAHAGQP
jgi:hypothetical protein